MLKNRYFRRFRVIKIFAFQTDIQTDRQTDIQTDQGTHPLIESLRQRLKTDFNISVNLVCGAHEIMHVSLS